MIVSLCFFSVENIKSLETNTVDLWTPRDGNQRDDMGKTVFYDDAKLNGLK